MRSAGPCMSPFNAWVFTKGLETLGLRMQRHSAFAVKGGHAGAWNVIDHVKLCSITGNLGDSRTTITHPTTTTHGRMSAEDRAIAGIEDDLVRVAVGLEHIDDLIADLDQAISAAQRQRA